MFSLFLNAQKRPYKWDISTLMLQTLQTEGTSTPVWPSLSFNRLRQGVTEH